MSVTELKAFLKERGVSLAGVTEKSELVALARTAQEQDAKSGGSSLEMDEEFKRQRDAARKALKAAKKQGATIQYSGFVDGITTEIARHFGTDVATLTERLQERLQVLHAAFSCLYTSSHQMNHERAYQNLVLDLLQHEQEWFSAIFVSLDNSVYAERCCGIIGTLCTIRRQRGTPQEAADLMPLYDRVMSRYQDMTARRKGPEYAAQRNCCRGLAYKKNVVKMNVMMQTNQLHLAIPEYRQAIKYELEEGWGFEQQNYAYTLAVLGPRYASLTVKQLDKVDDKSLERALLMVLAEEQRVSGASTFDPTVIAPMGESKVGGPLQLHFAGPLCA